MILFFIAYRINSAIECKASFLITFARWVSAVLVVIPSDVPTSLLVLPSARSCTISSSRGVSCTSLNTVFVDIKAPEDATVPSIGGHVKHYIFLTYASVQPEPPFPSTKTGLVSDKETPDPIAEAKAKIKGMNRTPEDVLPVLTLPPGQAHRTAALTYQHRNREEGKCAICPQPLAHNSVRYYETHLAVCRNRARARAKKLNKPPHGRAPGTLAALAESRKKAKGEMNLWCGADFETKIKGASAAKLLRPLLIAP
jgi:hypothetical protein